MQKVSNTGRGGMMRMRRCLTFHMKTKDLKEDVRPKDNKSILEMNFNEIKKMFFERNRSLSSL